MCVSEFNVCLFGEEVDDGCMCRDGYFGDRCQFYESGGENSREKGEKAEIYFAKNKELLFQLTTVFALKITDQKEVNSDLSEKYDYHWGIIDKRTGVSLEKMILLTVKRKGA